MSRLSILHFGVCKCCMWNPSRPPIRLPVVALDEHDLLWRLLAFVVPPMRLVRQNRTRFSHPIGINQLDRNNVFVWHRVRVANRKRVLVDGFNRPPNIDELKSGLQKSRAVFSQMSSDLILRRPFRLVDMGALDGPSFVVRASSCGIRSSDCVIKDANTARSSARRY